MNKTTSRHKFTNFPTPSSSSCARYSLASRSLFSWAVSSSSESSSSPNCFSFLACFTPLHGNGYHDVFMGKKKMVLNAHSSPSESLAISSSKRSGLFLFSCAVVVVLRLPPWMHVHAKNQHQYGCTSQHNTPHQQTLMALQQEIKITQKAYPSNMT